MIVRVKREGQVISTASRAVWAGAPDSQEAWARRLAIAEAARLGLLMPRSARIIFSTEKELLVHVR